MSFDILSRYTGAVVFSSTSAHNIASAVVDAVLRGANLYGANLYGANLHGANLCEADLRRANLYGANLYGANLHGADLYGANLYGADLHGADLRGAVLYRANLYGANLYGADLYEANLCEADLRRANLREAKGVSIQAATPLAILLDQPGKIRAYKLVNSRGEGPYNGGIVYEIGKSVEVLTANTDSTENCAEGINVATLGWCVREWRDTYKILVVEFEASDIAAIPLTTDGKFRLFRCTVVSEKNLHELGLVK
jgi:hypothetical protein